jgi:hypothetical protein
MNGIFDRLDDTEYFVDFITKRITDAPLELSSVMFVRNVYDIERLSYAADEYRQNINKFAVLLHSRNPDHYKRAGSLLHALYQSQPIVSVECESSVEELEAGYTRVNFGDAQHILPFAKFYNEYANEVMSFDIAYRCCASYESKPPSYDFDYLHNVCRYLNLNKNLSVDSLFLLFKSLMVI